ncbi:hypothetical protein [Conexibacter sp. SYSU D00693]|uniref:hypothetical protein n=1 Tax=Conexibacter sp. SYSU D00693 TaxID=2812560 RepID=UPI00196B4EB6|nr:hypothetical protein [Conexibacter sp. SYSU D00693]
MSRGILAEAVLARAAGAVAVRCDLPLDRLEDAVLVLATLLGGAAPDREDLEVTLEPWQRAMAVRAGPFAPGEAQRLLDLDAGPGVGVLQSLVGGATVEPGSRGDFLSLVVAADADGPAL